jgi:arylsulfatase A-like enzyme/lipopolysaccharide biosynthesis regulator YciM
MDTTRADHIGYYGYKNVKTPNIDKLANKGMVFLNAITPVPITLPSHSTILTGKYPVSHGVRNNGRYILSENELTLAEILKKRKYDTYAVVASYVLHSKFGTNQGFDIYNDTLNSKDMKINFKTEISAEDVFIRFKDWLESRNNSISPFFAWVHFYDPHTPYKFHKGYTNIKNRTIEKHMNYYDGEISYMDSYIGKIIDKLKENEYFNNTIIVLVGDHGETFGEHKEFASHAIFCYTENIHVPLIFYYPVKKYHHKIINKMVSTVDIMPTILDLLGIKIPRDIQGKSLVPYFKNKKKETGDRLFYMESMYGKEEMGWAPLTGIIKFPYKYIALPKPELYDLEKDPEEKNNLYFKRKKISKSMDLKLKKMIIDLSKSKNETENRKLSEKDIKILNSLGYISSSQKSYGKKIIDPKDGIIVNLELKKISRMINKKMKLKEMERKLLNIIENKPDMITPIVYNLLYKLYFSEKKYKKALFILDEGIKRFPDFSAYKVTKIGILKSKRKFTEAKEIAEKLIKKEPLNTNALILLSDIYDKSYDIEKSIYYLEKAYKIEPNNIPLSLKLADIFIENKQFQKAYKIYKKLSNKVEIQNNRKILYKIAIFSIKYGELDLSLKIFKRLEKIEPNSKDIMFYHAIVLYKLNDFNKAKKILIKLKKQYNNLLTEKQNEIVKQIINNIN